MALTSTRIVCLIIAFASVVGLFFLGQGNPSAARADTSSSLTVSWAGDTSSAAAFQPARSSASPHYNGFKNISVTVDQTTGIGDQAIQVSVAGFAGTTQATDFAGATWTSAQNFFQAMQCWGPDPLATNFNQTCEWGGKYANNNGLGNTVYLDNIPRVAAKDIQPNATNPTDVPFTTFGGTTISGRLAIQGGNTVYPLLDYFGPDTTNEVQSARINGDGTGVFNFETQTSEEAPQLGCGNGSHTRCWLVLVPRGTVYGGHDNSCSDILDNSNNPYTYGRPNSIQAGSPVNPACDYWTNRIDIPLDFNPTGNTCAQGGTERRLIGSQLLVGAMASWQPKLCTDLNTAFNFSTNPDSVAREQLLDQQAGLAFSSFPIVSSELDNAVGVSELKTTALSYAPVAITSANIAFLAEGPSGRIDSLRLTPRLLAKLLTQSYRFTVPWNTSDPAKNVAHLGTVNQSYYYLNQDPDFRAVNSNWAQFTQNPAIVLPGPSGADAIRQLWKWIVGDTEAATWLSGTPDQWGMTINPYYLPKGNANAKVPTFTDAGDYAVDGSGSPVYRQVGLSKTDGTPLQLSTTVQDSFLKADESQVPLKLNTERYRFGSLQFAPYADNFLVAARTAFRANPGAKTVWDPTAIDSAGDTGDWVSAGAQIPGQRFVISITDGPSAVKYALSSAALRLDNTTDQYVQPTDASLTAAMNSALVATSLPAVKQIDPTAVGAGAYPLTTVAYAIVNLTASDAAARKDFSNFIGQVTTKGQVPGDQLGELPPGYIPLPTDLANQAIAAAAAVASYVSPTASNGSAQDTYNGGTNDGSFDGSSGAGAIGASSSPIPGAPDGKTPQVDASPVAQVALGGSLITGIGGALFSPFLFRGRRLH